MNTIITKYGFQTIHQFTKAEKHIITRPIIKSIVLSTDEIFTNLLNNLCDDMFYYIAAYLQLHIIRRHCIYVKLHDHFKLYKMMQVFTCTEINQHFHADDLFGMSVIKDIAINDYIRFNLSKLQINQLTNNSDYINLRKIVICAKLRNAMLQNNAIKSK